MSFTLADGRKARALIRQGHAVELVVKTVNGDGQEVVQANVAGNLKGHGKSVVYYKTGSLHPQEILEFAARDRVFET